MSPLNRGPSMAPRFPPSNMRPLPMGRYGRTGPPPHIPTLPPGMSGRPPMPPPMPFRPRGRPLPPPLPPRSAMMHGMYGLPLPPSRPMGMPMMPGGSMPPPPMMRGVSMGPRGAMPMRLGPRGMMPPQALPHIRPRFPPNSNNKTKQGNKKSNKLEGLELKKPWMTDEIRFEIQKKNKLYAKAKKNKDAKEWEEFKDLRNKVTRMIRDAKNEYLAKHPDQVHLYENDEEYGAFDTDDFNSSSGSEDEDADPEVFYCEVCDREFNSKEHLSQHITEHKTCGLEGCTFTAHPKIVEKHISMQHGTGLYQRMKHAMNNEDIEKWKIERKKRYPTAINTQLREREELEKKKRGEVIEKQNGKFREKPKREIRKRPRRNRTKRRQQQQQQRLVGTSVESSIATEPQLYRGLLPFAGIGVLDEINDSVCLTEDKELYVEPEEVTSNKSDIEISDEEVFNGETSSVQPQEPKVSTKPDTANSLSLVADYGSASSDDEPPEEAPIDKCKLNDNLRELRTQNSSAVEGVKNIESDTSKNQSMEVTKTDVIDVTNNSSPTTCLSQNDNSSKRKRKLQNDIKDSNINSKKQCKNNSSISNNRLKLLNRLLARSIQHERNVICQCITFIANNNFLQ